MHTAAINKQRRKRPGPAPEDWLDALCRHRFWSEREVLSVLADVSPTVSGDARTKTETTLAREAPARRAAASEYVGHAIGHEHLRVNWKLRQSDLERIDDEQLRAQVQEAISVTTLYANRYTVTPATVIRWFFTDRTRFPSCRLTDAHLAIAEATENAAGSTAAALERLISPAAPTALHVGASRLSTESSTSAGREDVLQQPAEWFRQKKDGRGLKALGMDPKTAKKILDGKEVAERTLDTLARRLHVSREDIPGGPQT